MNVLSCLSVGVSVGQSLFICRSESLYLCWWVSLPVGVSVDVPVGLSLCLSVTVPLSVGVSVGMCLCRYVSLLVAESQRFCPSLSVCPERGERRGDAVRPLCGLENDDKEKRIW